MPELANRAEPSVYQTLIPAIRKSLAWVLALTVLGAVLGGVSALATGKTYTARSQLILLPVSATNSGDINSSTNVAHSLATSYALAATSTEVLKAVVANTGTAQTLTELTQSTTATVPAGTVVIDIAVEDETPDGAAKLANAISTEFIKKSPEIMPKQTNGATVVQLKQLRVADAPKAPSSLGLRVLVPIGAFLGLAAGLAVALLRRHSLAS